MKSFHSFLVEKTVMSPADAARLLGVTVGCSKEELKKGYANAARKYHPDRPENRGEKPDANGFTMIQKVNLAYETLEKMTGQVAQQADRDQFHRDYKAKSDAFAQVAKDEFNARFQATYFTAHFDAFFEEPFAVKGGWGQVLSGTSVYYTAEWSNDAKTIVLELSVGVNFGDLFNSRTLAGADEMLSMYVTTEILYNRKKVKLSQANYRFDTSTKILRDPEVLFPVSKLKAQTAKSSTRKFSRRDALLTFEKELGGRQDNENMWVPLSDKHKILMWRMTMMKQGAWGINGLYGPTYDNNGKLFNSKRVAQLDTCFFSEQQDHMQFLFDALKSIQKRDDASKTNASLEKELNVMIAKYKSEFRGK